MIAYDALGDRARVASTYQRCVQALRELDLEPSEQTRALAFKRNSKLNIPIPLTSFIGREKELKEIADLFSKSRLVTLTGSGGVGKTRLVIQVVADVLDRFPDGLWFLDLAPLSDPALVPYTLVNLLGLRQSGEIPLTEMLINYFRTRTTLVIFDNCEHLIESCAQLVNSLLTSCEGLSVLATSREALRVSGEIPYRVPSLTIPRSYIQFAVNDLANMESIRLFTERAALISPSFAFNSQNAFDIARICQRLDGIPLAIELAAARVHTLTVEQISKRLDDRLNLLNNGLRTSLPRHQTLRAMIEWSYDLLPEKERILFRRLAVFAGGWTLEAAEEVCGGNGIESRDILDLLSQLVNKSLMLLETLESETRYHRLETIHQFAREKLAESSEEKQVRARHLDFFLNLAEKSEPFLWDAAEQVLLKRLEVEWDNMRAALQWSLEYGFGEQRLRLAAALVWFWSNHSESAEGRRWLGEVLAPQAEAPVKVRASTLHKAGHMAMLLGNYEDATALIEESRELYSALENSLWYRAWNYHELGMIALFQGNYARAAAMSIQSLSLFEEIGDRGGVASQQLYVGMIAYYQGDNERARSLLVKSLPVLQEIDNYGAVARVLHSLGLIEHRQGNYKRASALLKESLIAVQHKGSRLEIVEALEGLGGVACAQGAMIRAAQLFGAAESLRSVIGVPLQPGIRDDHDRNVAALRAQLDEQTFTKVWVKGHAMTLGQAVDYALGAEIG